MTEVRLRCIAHELAAHPRAVELFGIISRDRTVALNTAIEALPESLGRRELLGLLELPESSTNLYLEDLSSEEIGTPLPPHLIADLLAANPIVDVRQLLTDTVLPRMFIYVFLREYYLPYVAQSLGWDYVLKQYAPDLKHLPEPHGVVISPIAYIVTLLDAVSDVILGSAWIDSDQAVPDLRRILKLDTDEAMYTWLIQFYTDLRAAPTLPPRYDLKPSPGDIQEASKWRDIVLLNFFLRAIDDGLAKPVPVHSGWSLKPYLDQAMELLPQPLSPTVQAVLEQVYFAALASTTPEDNERLRTYHAWVAELGIDIDACITRTLTELGGGGAVQDTRLQQFIGGFMAP